MDSVVKARELRVKMQAVAAAFVGAGLPVPEVVLVCAACGNRDSVPLDSVLRGPCSAGCGAQMDAAYPQPLPSPVAALPSPPRPVPARPVPAEVEALLDALSAGPPSPDVAPLLSAARAAIGGWEALHDAREACGGRPDDEEKYTPDWARSQFGDLPTFAWSGPDGQPASLTILWAKEDAWLSGLDGEGSVAIPLPAKGAARRLVAAIRECCEKKETGQ